MPSWNRQESSVFGIALGLIVFAFAEPAQAASQEANIKAILSVSAEGQGHQAAIDATKELSQGPAESLVPLLTAFDTANPLAVNWLRGIVDTVAERHLKKAGSLPADKLEGFVKETRHSAEARRLAYEWLVKVDATASDRLIPGMLQDASPEFRRDAVQRLIKQAVSTRESGEKEASIGLFRKALSGAVDDDQVKAIVGPLREMNEVVDLQKHFGFLTEWSMAGPFDNTALKGYDVAYPPEKQVDLKAKYEGKEGEVTWQKLATTDEYGLLNIAKQISPYKGAAMYATTQFTSDADRPVEFRLSTPNAWKLWVNGELVFARDEYHRGTQLDQYRVQSRLRRGDNLILFKICQNEQKEEWAQDYKFQMRICDSTGAAILSKPAAVSTTRK